MGVVDCIWTSFLAGLKELMSLSCYPWAVPKTIVHFLLQRLESGSWNPDYAGYLMPEYDLWCFWFFSFIPSLSEVGVDHHKYDTATTIIFSAPIVSCGSQKQEVAIALRYTSEYACGSQIWSGICLLLLCRLLTIMKMWAFTSVGPLDVRFLLENNRCGTEQLLWWNIYHHVDKMCRQTHVSFIEPSFQTSAQFTRLNVTGSEVLSFRPNSHHPVWLSATITTLERDHNCS